MEFFSPIRTSWPLFRVSSFLLAHYYTTPQNRVHWVETPESHLFSADLPGVRKEEIRVEVEDSMYMMIRTERVATDGEGVEVERAERRGFMRKFRLPPMINFDGITAAYENGVLTVTVPRSVSRRMLQINPEDVAEERNFVARAA